MDPPTHFKAPSDFRAWLEANHRTSTELWVLFYKTHTGLPSLTWPQSVDEALCFGWIDGLRKSLDDTSYIIRFTQRKRTSTWSAVNLKRVLELIEEGRMQPAGLEAWEKRIHSSKLGYTYDAPDQVLGELEATEFRLVPLAWEFFEEQSQAYRRTVSRWVMSAKRPRTRQKRLHILIADSVAGRKLGLMTRYRKK